MSQPALFQPLKVGQMDLQHRIVMAPLTRFRADDQFVHTDMAIEYYRQRASTPGTLLITEATFVSPQAGMYAHVPGLWNKDQVAAWKKITDAVHKEGSYIYCQLWALGRVADPSLLKKHGLDVISSGDIPVEGGATPRSMTKDDIKSMVKDYENAAKNALEAGFDGVEFHNANGYLPDQFLEDTANNRTDEYGGSVENRSRFSLEVMEKLVSVLGQDKVGIRLSPYSPFQGMKMADPIPQFTHLAKELASRFPKLAYLHGVESRISGNADVDEKPEQINFLRDAWGHDKVFFRAGGYKKDSSIRAAHDEPKTAVVMGRLFISNPDLPRRWKNDVQEEPYNRDLFYNATEAHGYIDYKAATEA